VRRSLMIAAGVALALFAPAYAAGVDSRAYTCAALQSMIAARGFVFISLPAFGDFVVANVSYCSGVGGGGGVLQLRSVATTDSPECVVNCCVSRGMMGGSGSGM
jgi:hypothetical protein